MTQYGLAGATASDRRSSCTAWHDVFELFIFPAESPCESAAIACVTAESPCESAGTLRLRRDMGPASLANVLPCRFVCVSESSLGDEIQSLLYEPISTETGRA